jgi:hypothetical protein
MFFLNQPKVISLLLQSSKLLQFLSISILFVDVIGFFSLLLILFNATTYLLEVVLFAFGIGHLYDYILMLILMLTNSLFLPRSLEGCNLAIKHFLTCYLVFVYNLACCGIHVV